MERTKLVVSRSVTMDYRLLLGRSGTESGGLGRFSLAMKLARMSCQGIILKRFGLVHSYHDWISQTFQSPKTIYLHLIMSLNDSLQELET